MFQLIVSEATENCYSQPEDIASRIRAMLPLPTLNHQLLQEAQGRGFVVQEDPEAWRIRPSSGEPWTLCYNSTQERWILIVQDIPQIRFTPSEALDFLARLK